jgi:hypothetical protein
MNNGETPGPFAASPDAGDPAGENEYGQRQRGADHLERSLACAAIRPGCFSGRDSGGRLTHIHAIASGRNKKGPGSTEAFDVSL